MRFLASVTGTEEAETALAGGADIIDLKDPAAGALGAVAPWVVDRVVERVAGRRPVSAVAGDLPMAIPAVRAAVEARCAADYVKIGLFPAGRAEREAVIANLGDLAGRVGLIAVFFADGEPDLALIEALARAGFAGAMVDTMGKDGQRLLDRWSVADCAAFVARARSHGLMTGLAGSLEAADVPRLAIAGPDYLGFRGALTGTGRASRIEAGALGRVRAALTAADIAAEAGSDEPGAATGEGAIEGDRVFVSDMVIDLAIGAYAHEHGRSQRVRFSVDARVAPFPQDAASIADVYSYDVIMDAVRSLASRGHTDLVETLALDLARTLLADRRLARVTVRVEKLDLGPGSVGVEITRSQAVRAPVVAQRDAI